MSALFIVRAQRPLIAAVENGTSPPFDWINKQETYYCMDDIDGEIDPDAPEKDRPSFYLPQVPVPELRIDDPDFALDMFFMGWWMVSARMREALALREDEAVFRDAKIVGAPGPARLGYAAVEPTNHLDGINPERSDLYEIGDPGSPDYFWRLDSKDNKRPRVALRPGLQAPAPLFYMDRTDWLMITTEAAQRVRSAGITNVFFDEPSPIYGSWMNGPP